MTNIYKLRAQLLTEKYEPFFEDFKQYKDDRILVPNCRDQLLEGGPAPIYRFPGGDSLVDECEMLPAEEASDE